MDRVMVEHLGNVVALDLGGLVPRGQQFRLPLLAQRRKQTGNERRLQMGRAVDVLRAADDLARHHARIFVVRRDVKPHDAPVNRPQGRVLRHHIDGVTADLRLETAFANRVRAMQRTCESRQAQDASKRRVTTAAALPVRLHRLESREVRYFCFNWSDFAAHAVMSCSVAVRNAGAMAPHFMRHWTMHIRG